MAPLAFRNSSVKASRDFVDVNYLGKVFTSKSPNGLERGYRLVCSVFTQNQLLRTELSFTKHYNYPLDDLASSVSIITTTNCITVEVGTRIEINHPFL